MNKILKDILGNHPDKAQPIGILKSDDQVTDLKLPHRSLSCDDKYKQDFINLSAEWLIKHHADDSKIARYKKALLRQELISHIPQSPLPTKSITQKGNWAEIVLAEYLESSSGVELPVYKLRFNSNINESMKGDDVLAFDLDSDPIRIIVGEAKFRTTPQKQDVKDMVKNLINSNLIKIPLSLGFVVDRLYEQGMEDIANKVHNCEVLIASGDLKIDYVGLLASDQNVSKTVKKHAESNLKNLVVISLNINDPQKVVSDSYLKANKILKENS